MAFMKQEPSQASEPFSPPFNNEWETPSPSPEDRTCTICSAPSNGYHFNAASCSACAAFFRRTVTLNRTFSCTQNRNCRVDYAMRVICRACRYDKCIHMGMERQAVQPRRDCNVGRRKITYTLKPPLIQPTVIEKPTPRIPSISEAFPLVDEPATSVIFDAVTVASSYSPPKNDPITFMDTSAPNEDIHYAASYSSSASEDRIPSPKTSYITQTPESIFEDLMREARLQNERRKILYCGHSNIADLLSTCQFNDIPYTKEDLKELTFMGIQKDIRSQILVIYEWMRAWPYFHEIKLGDKKMLLRRCVLYHTILEPAYLSVRLGLPNRFVMFNGMYVGVPEDSQEGWKDEENYISADLKKKLYRPLLERVVKEVAIPMQNIGLTYIEFTFLKALVSFRSASVFITSSSLKERIHNYIDMLFRALHYHYSVLGHDSNTIAERTGNVVLLMSSIFAVGMEAMESHQKIQFFDLWELDDLLLRLIARAS